MGHEFKYLELIKYNLSLYMCTDILLIKLKYFKILWIHLNLYWPSDAISPKKLVLIIFVYSILVVSKVGN